MMTRPFAHALTALVLSLAILLAPARAHAQHAPVQPLVPSPEAAVLALSDPTERAIIQARRMRTAGIVLTATGAAIGLAAGIVGIWASRDTRDFGEGLRRAGAAGWAASLGIASGALLIPGVVLWPLGQSRLDRARRAQLGLASAPAGSLGSGVAVRF